MANSLIFLIIGFFLSLLFLNVYFRVKVLKVYKVLVQNKIEFNGSHIFSNEKMATEILPKYPGFEKEIVSFASHIKRSLGIAVILILLIAIAGFILNYQ